MFSHTLGHGWVLYRKGLLIVPSTPSGLMAVTAYSVFDVSDAGL